MFPLSLSRSVSLYCALIYCIFPLRRKSPVTVACAELDYSLAAHCIQTMLKQANNQAKMPRAGFPCPCPVLLLLAALSSSARSIVCETGAQSQRRCSLNSARALENQTISHPLPTFLRHRLFACLSLPASAAAQPRSDAIRAEASGCRA